MVVAIIDIEIANNLKLLPVWDNKKADIMLIGAIMVDDDQIQSIIQIPRLVNMTKDRYANLIRKMLDSLLQAGYSLFALNCNFEREAIQAYCGIGYKFGEVKGTLNGALTSKEKLYAKLHDKLKLPYIHDVLNGDSGKCPDFYTSYLADNNLLFLQQILAHNLNCLLKEQYILQNLGWLEENAILDDGGYVKGWKFDNDKIGDDKIDKNKIQGI